MRQVVLCPRADCVGFEDTCFCFVVLGSERKYPHIEYIMHIYTLSLPFVFFCALFFFFFFFMRQVGLRPRTDCVVLFLFILLLFLLVLGHCCAHGFVDKDRT